MGAVTYEINEVVIVPYLYLSEPGKVYYLDSKLINNPISVNLDAGIIRYRTNGQVKTEWGRVEKKDKSAAKKQKGTSKTEKRAGVGAGAAFS